MTRYVTPTATRRTTSEMCHENALPPLPLRRFAAAAAASERAAGSSEGTDGLVGFFPLPMLVARRTAVSLELW